MEKYGMLTIIGVPFSAYPTELSKDRKKYVKCICVCGNTKNIILRSLIDGNTKSCGCYQKSFLLTHGLYKHTLYSKWWSIKKRCYGIKSKYFYLYGGRGIVMAKQWKDDFMSFYNWSIKNGWAEGLQIDRIDNNGNYTPENCRYVEAKTNAQNRRTTKINTDIVNDLRSKKYAGMTHNQIGRTIGVSQATVTQIINKKTWI